MWNRLADSLVDWLLHWLMSAEIVKSTFVSACISHPCLVIINFQYITKKMRAVSSVQVNITGKKIQWDPWRKCFTASAFLLRQTDANIISDLHPLTYRVLEFLPPNVEGLNSAHYVNIFF